MKLDLSSPEVIKFYIACINRENEKRINWSIKNAEAIRHAAQFHREPKNYTVIDPLLRSQELGIPTITRDYLSSTRHRRVKPSVDLDTVRGIKYLRKENTLEKLGRGDPESDPRLARPDTDLSLDPVMRLVDPETKQILYESPPPRRDIYLKKRMKIRPDEKYYYPQTEYMEFNFLPCESEVYKRRKGTDCDRYNRRRFLK